MHAERTLKKSCDIRHQDVQLESPASCRRANGDGPAHSHNNLLAAPAAAYKHTPNLEYTAAHIDW
jgi:hypothetical protein